MRNKEQGEIVVKLVRERNWKVLISIRQKESSGTNFCRIKEELIKLIAQHMTSEEARGTIKQPFIVTEGDNTYRVERNGCELIYRCNHEEADTRLVLHASMEAADVAIVSKDTDVLILLILAYSKLSVCKTWLFKYNHDKYADIGVICQFLGNDLCQALPAIHAISGCDTTSYFYKAGKV